MADRVPYYWGQPEVRSALERLTKNLGEKPLPYPLLSQFAGQPGMNAAQVIEGAIDRVLEDYQMACGRWNNAPENHTSHPVFKYFFL